MRKTTVILKFVFFVLLLCNFVPAFGQGAPDPSDFADDSDPDPDPDSLPAPIDDYIEFLFVLGLLVGSYFVKKQQEKANLFFSKSK